MFPADVLITKYEYFSIFLTQIYSGYVWLSLAMLGTSLFYTVCCVDIGLRNVLFPRNLAIRRINPFLANVPILYPLKTFTGYKMGTLARNGLILWLCQVSFANSEIDQQTL